MRFAFGPDGIDDDVKQRAEEGEEALTKAGLVFGVAAAGAAIMFPPLVPGLALAAALGPVLALPLQRIKKDPPRSDFHETVRVSPPLDPTAILDQGIHEYPPELLSALVAYPVSADRTAAHLGAMVTAAERAMGAYAGRSTAALDLRIAEGRVHAQRALSSATALSAATVVLHKFIHGSFDDLKMVAEQSAEAVTFEDLLRDRDAAGPLLAIGLDDAFLMQHPVPRDVPWATIDSHTLDDAGDAIYRLMRVITSDFPPTVEDFIASGEESGASARGYA